ncbi:TonB-dependent receptor [Martelella alba]|uniref:TonB-dependent receptor n=1 Tax=Martelella alba TaxID=2590451 RepID=UPI001E4D2B8D|nr:TonB-dependent receptor [Martelella alba]
MLGTGLRYSGKTEISPDNTRGTLGGNVQYDMAASYDMAVVAPQLEGLTLKAGAQNLTNRFSYTCYSAAYCWIYRDRTWQVGLNYRC